MGLAFFVTALSGVLICRELSRMVIELKDINNRLVTGLLFRADHESRYSHSTQKYSEDHIAEARIECCCECARQCSIDHAHPIKRQKTDNTSVRIDHGGDSRVGCTRNGKSLLNSAHACNQKMLFRPRPGSKPGIVGYINQPARPDTGRHGAGKNNLVADQGRDVGRAWKMIGVRDRRQRKSLPDPRSAWRCQDAKASQRTAHIRQTAPDGICRRSRPAGRLDQKYTAHCKMRACRPTASARAEPVIRLWPPAVSLAISSKATGERSNRKGGAASGQMMWVTRPGVRDRSISLCQFRRHVTAYIFLILRNVGLNQPDPYTGDIAPRAGPA